MTKSERLNLELAFLSDKRVFHLRDLTSKFHISRRTALRDVQTLEELGLPLYSEVGADGGYKILQHRPLIPILFSNQEISAIFFALTALKKLSATPFPQSYPTIAEKLMASLSPDQRESVIRMQQAVHYYSEDSITYPRYLNEFLTLILERRAARVVCPPRWGTSAVTIQALELLYRNGIWFCEAANRSTETWVTLRLDQVEEFTPLPQASSLLDVAQLRRMQQEYEHTHHDITFSCLVTEKGAEKFFKNHYPNMHLRAQGKLFELYGGYNHDEYDYMLDYLLSLGAEVTVQAPRQLREGYAARLKSLLSRYE